MIHSHIIYANIDSLHTIKTITTEIFYTKKQATHTMHHGDRESQAHSLKTKWCKFFQLGVLLQKTKMTDATWIFQIRLPTMNGPYSTRHFKNQILSVI